MTTPSTPVTVESLMVHREWVRSLARRLVLDESRADDLVQQTWLRVLRSPPDSGHSPRAWLGTVVRNLARDAARRKERRDRREQAAAVPEAQASVLDLVAQAEALGRVVQAVVALDEPYRTTILLRFFEGLPPRDVAARMDVPTETVRTRVRRALERMRGTLEPEDEEERARARAGLLALAGLGLTSSAAAASPMVPRWAWPAGAAAILVVGTGLLWDVGAASDLEPATPIDAVAATAESPVPPGDPVSRAPDGDKLTAEVDPQDDRPAGVSLPAKSVAEGPASETPEGDPPPIDPRPEKLRSPAVLRPVPPPPMPAEVTDRPSAAAAPDVAASTPPSETYRDADTSAWGKRYERQLEFAAKSFTSLSEWCASHDLEWTSLRIRRRVLRYLPDDAATRSLLGYERAAGSWERNDAVLDRLRSFVLDDADPGGAAYGRAYAEVQKRVSTRFRKLARQAGRRADEAREASKTLPAMAWKQHAAQAWERVLQLDPGVAAHRLDAHEALGHGQFVGRHVTSFQLRYMTRRAERARRGQVLAAHAPTARNVPLGGPLKAAGIEGGAAQSEHVVVYTSHGPEVAVRQARAVERALADGLAVYGWPKDLLDARRLREIHGVKRAPSGAPEEFRRVLLASGMKKKTVEMYVAAGFGGVRLGEAGQLITTTDGRDAEDNAMNVIHHDLTRAAAALARAELNGRLSSPEDWLWQSMAYDCTQRINGTTTTIWGSFRAYGRGRVARPGQNLWIELAREQVELDDDVPLHRLVNLQLASAEFTGREIVKSYAFLQYLLESDETRAREFVRHALAHGSAIAAMHVFGVEILGAGGVPPDPVPDADSPPAGHRPGALSKPFRRVLDELDRRYAEWIEKAW